MYIPHYGYNCSFWNQEQVLALVAETSTESANKEMAKALAKATQSNERCL